MRHKKICGLVPNDWQKNNGRGEDFHEQNEYSFGNVELESLQDTQMETSKGQLSKNDLLQKGKHKFNYMENTLNMAASQKAFVMGYCSVFNREHLPEVYLVMLMKTMMKRKEGEGKGKERRYRRQGRGGKERWKSSNT